MQYRQNMRDTETECIKFDLCKIKDIKRINTSIELRLKYNYVYALIFQIIIHNKLFFSSTYSSIICIL